MERFKQLSILLLALAMACGDDDNPTPQDAGTDATADGTVEDAGPATTIEELPVDETITTTGGRVDAVRDERGMWHLYGDNLNDIFYAQGYLQARDRAGQMEFIRRFATGRLADFAGSLDPSLIDDDRTARFEGHARNAARIFEAMSDEEKALLESHCAGMNAWIAKIRNNEVSLPRGVLGVLDPSVFTDWTPTDVLAIARFQAASLSFDGNDDVNATRNLAAWLENFPEDAADDRLSARRGAFHDLFPFQPAQRVYNRDGFPNESEDTGSRARPRPAIPSSGRNLPALEALEAATNHLDRMESRFARIFGGDEFRGSNSWVVSGDHTESGNAIMANDPHLSLTSPPLFWQAHINTVRAGGNVDVAGQMIAGTPVNILGFNKDLAWGLTTSGYDVTDVYLEQITSGDAGEPDTVLFNGEQVEIQIIEEEIAVAGQAPITVQFELVPHHGLIIPGSRVEEDGNVTALSLAWTGNQVSNESGAFLDMYTATTADEARQAFRRFEVGGQTLVVATKDGDIDYTSSVTIPVRPAAALSYDPATFEGASPCFVLDGTGAHEWARNGDGTIQGLDFRLIPHDRNPDKGFIATANADPVGVTDDGNPHNDAAFIGCNFADGHRLARIDERLRELVTAGDITVEQMSALQNDAVSPHGRMLTGAIVAALNRALEERDTPDTHADLTAAVADLTDVMDDIADARDRLMAWTFDTPAAVEGNPDAATQADSVATSIFNLTFSHLADLALGDEYDFFNDGELNDSAWRTNKAAITLDLMITEPMRLASYSEDLGASILWDHLGTDAVESMDERILRAVAAALGSLADQLGEDVGMWRWGRLHTIRLNSVVPAFGADVLSIPPDGHEFENGFPRHGDRGVVDASSFGTFQTSSFRYRSGPQQRLVVEMTPEGPRAVNALPGGNVEDPDSPFHANEMELWRHNMVEPVPFTEAEVLDRAAEHVVFESN